MCTLSIPSINPIKFYEMAILSGSINPWVSSTGRKTGFFLNAYTLFYDLKICIINR